MRPARRSARDRIVGMVGEQLAVVRLICPLHEPLGKTR